MKKTRWASVAAVFVWEVSSFGPTVAQDASSLQSARSPMAIIKLFDSNGDNRIAQSEVREKNIEAFDSVDSNRDGFLVAAETPSLSTKSFSAADKNKDGKLSPYEYSQAEFLHFELLDTNKDSFVTAEEIAAFQKREKSR